jgi:UDP-N-acetylmuramoyl-tripeptide--D-alanyl-D-alanine ligase
MLIAAFVFALAGFGVFVFKRLKRYLHFFQQDEYDNKRFLAWVMSARAVDTRVTLAAFALAVAAYFVDAAPAWLWPALFGALFLIASLFESDPTKTGKKPLVMTQRATTLFRLALGLGVVFAAVVGWLIAPWGWLLAVQAPPLLLVAANTLLAPVEKNKQLFFLNDAKRRLKEINPTVVGVTGSFGKTTIKHILGHILGMADNAFFTPGSVNTPMGVSRVIREQLPADTRFFVVEMGAYGPGSIKRLCDLTPPSFGLITAIGEAHFERFKTLDTVAHAKFELAEAVMKTDGQMVVHESVLAQPYARAFVDRQRERFIVCGPGAECDVRVGAWTQTPEGLKVTVVWKGADYQIEAPIFGEHNVDNLAVAFGAATGLGVAPARVLAAIKSTPQTKHRLEVKRQGNGVILIDDAYNSNPRGFEAALGILSLLAEGRRRRVLVTPGMVELGEKHDELHDKLGGLAAQNADVVVVVKPDRIPTFVAAVKRARGEEGLVLADSFAEARKWLDANVASDAVILLENDLPDLYERKLSL